MEKKKKTKVSKETLGEKNSKVCEIDVINMETSDNEKVVKKAKLSLQKKDSGKRVVQTLLNPEVNLNDTEDFKEGKMVMEKYKSWSKSSKTSAAQKDITERKARSRLISKSNKHDKPSGKKEKSETVLRAPADSGDETVDKKYDNEDDNPEICGDGSTGNDVTDAKSSESDVAMPKSKIKKSGVTTTVPPRIRHCPTCDSDMENDVFKAHIMNCIDKFMKSMEERREKAKQAIKAKKQWREKTREAALMDEDEVEEVMDENYQCQICQQDLSDLNSVHRGVHVNKCIDQMENQGQTKKEGPRQSGVLDCPMCGKPLKTEAARKTHLKKCAKMLGVTTEQMMHLVKAQEKEHRHKSPTVAGPQVKKAKAGASTKQSKRKAKGPQDEATQLAMALSSSMADEERKQEQALIGQLNLRGIPDSTGQPAGKDGKKSRKKKNVQPAPKPLLLQLSKTEAHNRIAEKVTQLIVPQVNVDAIHSTPPTQESRLTDLPGTKLFMYGEGLTKSTEMLWQKTALLESEQNRYIRALYYTRALMPPVSMSCVVVGSKLRRVSEIPGRRKSEELTARLQEVSQEDQAVRESTPVVASTQTAVVLAELAAEDEDIEEDVDAETIVDVEDTESGTAAGQIDVSPYKVTASMAMEEDEDDDMREASGFCPEDLILVQDDARTECLSALQKDYLAILDNPLHSDVVIAARNKGIVHVHQVILATRCPALLQLNIDGVIPLHEVSREVVMSLMKYVYAGQAYLQPSYLQDIKDVAERCNIQELVKLCVAAQKSQQNPVQENIQDQPLDVESVERERLKSIDHLFQEMMSDEFSPQSEDDVCEKRNASDDNSDEDDWREIYCSQRQQLQRQKSLEMDVMAGGDQGGTAGDPGGTGGDQGGIGGDSGGAEGEHRMELGESKDHSSENESCHFSYEEEEVRTPKKQKYDKDEFESSFVFDKCESKDCISVSLGKNGNGEVFTQKESPVSKDRSGRKDEIQDKNKTLRKKDKVVTTAKEVTQTSNRSRCNDSIENTSNRSEQNCYSKPAGKSGTKMDMSGNRCATEGDKKGATRIQAVKSKSDCAHSTSKGKESSASHRKANVPSKKFGKQNDVSAVISRNPEFKSSKSSRTSDSVDRSRNESVKKTVTKQDEGTCGEDELFSDEELELALSSMDTSDHTTDIPGQSQDSKCGSKHEKRCNLGDKSQSSHVLEKNKSNRRRSPDADEFEIIKSGTSTSEEDVCGDAKGDDVHGSSGKLLPSPTVISHALVKESFKSSNKPAEALGREPVKSCNKTSEAAKRKRPPSDKDISDSPVFHKWTSKSRQESATPETKSSRKRVKLSTPHQKSGSDPSRDSDRNKMSTPLDKSSSSRSHSVVEQDSLYITPIPRERTRSTFMLNTPVTGTKHGGQSEDAGGEYVATPVGKIVKNQSGEEVIVGLSEAEKGSYLGVEILPPMSNIELSKLSDNHGGSGSGVGNSDVDDDRMSPIIQNTDVSHLSESVSQSLNTQPVGCNVDMEDHANSHVQQARESKDSDSDLEITGDNLLSLSHMSASPKFKSMFSLKKVASGSKASWSQQNLSLRMSSSSSRRESGSSAEHLSRERSELMEQPGSGGVEDSPSGVADVWEGFDDMDAGCHLEPFCDADTEESPQKKKESFLGSSQKKRYSHKRRVSYDGSTKSVAMESPSTPHKRSSSETNRHQEDEDDTLASPQGIQQGKVTVEFEVPGGDSFLWNDDNASEDNCNTNAECEQERQPSQTDNFKTPVACQPKKPGKKWVPPSPFTPIPDYDAMNTPQLKKEVSKFGVRPVGKKRMKILLKDIYEQTHQYETDSDYEPEKDLPQNSTSGSKSTALRTGQGEQPIKNQGFRKPFKTTVPAAASRKPVTSTSDTSASEDGGSQRSVTSSQESGCSDVPEESFLMDEDDVSASQQGNQADLHTKLMQFLQRRQDIHTRMLLYEPVELDWLKKEIQETGIKCSMQKLMDFLDEKCLTFTMKKMTKRNPNRRQPRKKKKVKVPAAAI